MKSPNTCVNTHMCYLLRNPEINKLYKPCSGYCITIFTTKSFDKNDADYRNIPNLEKYNYISKIERKCSTLDNSGNSQTGLFKQQNINGVSFISYMTQFRCQNKEESCEFICKCDPRFDKDGRNCNNVLLPNKCQDHSDSSVVVILRIIWYCFMISAFALEVMYRYGIVFDVFIRCVTHKLARGRPAASSYGPRTTKSKKSRRAKKKTCCCCI